MGVEGEAHEASGAELLVASGLPLALRRLLLEEGVWAPVRTRMIALDPQAEEWLDAPVSGTWYPLGRHLLAMRGVHDVVGERGVRELGRRRLRDALAGGVLSPLLRSWLRSYAAPEQFLRVVPHAWNGTTRNLGRMVVTGGEERELRLRVPAAPEPVRRSAAWQRFLEGFGVGLVEVVGLAGEVRVGPSTDDADLEIVASW